MSIYVKSNSCKKISLVLAMDRYIAQLFLPILGVGISDGKSSGAFAFAGAVGTFSGVNAKLIGKDGIEKPLHYQGKTRNARHEELMEDQKLYCVYVAI